MQEPKVPPAIHAEIMSNNGPIDTARAFMSLTSPNRTLMNQLEENIEAWRARILQDIEQGIIEEVTHKVTYGRYSPTSIGVYRYGYLLEVTEPEALKMIVLAFLNDEGQVDEYLFGTYLNDLGAQVDPNQPLQ